jgi:hypothetical protein
MYLDEGRKLFNIMGSGQQNLSGFISFILGKEVAKEWARAGKTGVKGNMVGNGVNLGGVWVIKGGDEPEVLIEYQEKHWGDAVDPDVVLAAVGATPSAKAESKRVSAKRKSSKRKSSKRASSKRASSKRASSKRGSKRESKTTAEEGKRRSSSSKRTSTKPRVASKRVEASA